MRSFQCNHCGMPVFFEKRFHQLRFGQHSYRTLSDWCARAMIGIIRKLQDLDNGRPRFVFAEDVTGILWNCTADAGLAGGVPAIQTRVRLSGGVITRADRQFLFSFSDIKPID